MAAARDDVAAFGPLCDRYAERLCRYCYRQLGSRERAEGTTGGIFANALTGSSAFHSASFVAWLCAIAHNVVTKSSRDARLTLSIVTAAIRADLGLSPEDVALAGEARQWLREVMALPPPDQRTVMELRLAGLTGVEIAAGMGRSHACVRMLRAPASTRLPAAGRVEAVPHGRD